MWQRVIWNAVNWARAVCPPYPPSFPYPGQLGFLGSLITNLPTGRFTMPYVYDDSDQQLTHNQPVDLSSSPNVLMESQFLSKNVYEPLSGDDEEDNPMDTPPPPSQEVVTTTTSMVSVVDKTAPLDSADKLEVGCFSQCHLPGTSISCVVDPPSTITSPSLPSRLSTMVVTVSCEESKAVPIIPPIQLVNSVPVTKPDLVSKS